LYGGGGGAAREGGSGGSGYIHAGSFKVGSKTYTNSTQQGGGAGSDGRGSVVVTYYADAELPVTFNGVKLIEIFFNGTKVERLIYNGAAVFMHKMKRRAAALACRMLLHKPIRWQEAIG